MSKSLKFMLLGIALMVFSMAGSRLWDALFNSLTYVLPRSPLFFDLMFSIVPLVGLVFVLLGFFNRD